MNPKDLVKYWEQAAKQPHGLRIKTNDRGLLRQQLYRARDMYSSGQYALLSIALPQEKDQLWIVRKDEDS